MSPEKMRPPVYDDRMQSGIAGQHLPCASGGWISLQNVEDIFPEAAKHGGGLYTLYTHRNSRCRVMSRVFFRLAALLVVAIALAMSPPLALPNEKIHRLLTRHLEFRWVQLSIQ